ncbi:GAF domain-containing protein [Nonomuraea sp. B12E4]|uniref:sensor histidine kinase n=1 Tax=Nonomuraea sp. B12E4 TaxID=3153564 RepID=UPI00325CFA79
MVPSTRLDELLAELQSRLKAVLAARDRVHALLGAVVSIGGELDLQTVLRRIAETATELVDARYGALGVVGQDNTLVQFIPVGVSEEEIARIEHWPHGRGLLGLLIKDARPLRLSRICDHPESYGFPSGHPPMVGFLGVPIRVRDKVFGNLYLTEKRDGGEFDEEDEAVAVALATAAGVAVENARLYEDSRRRETWLKASAEVTTHLLSGAEPREVLSTVVAHAREMSNADLVQLLLPDPSGRVLITEIAEGPGAEESLGTTLEIANTLAGDVFTQGEPMAEDDVQGVLCPDSLLRRLGYGPRLMVPLGAVEHVRGVLGLAKRTGQVPFSGGDEEVVRSFAGQAAIALELAEARRDAERLQLLEDRDRIGRDLHDVVIQRLFATAMTLMSTVRLIERPEAAERVRRAVDELDATIRQIRSTVFALQSGTQDGRAGLRARVVDLVEDAAGRLGFMPGLRLEGQLDTRVSEPLADHVLAVLREALSNMARHARASRAEVSVELGGACLTVVVTDNGVGLSGRSRRSGLRNIEERARQLGGFAEVEVPEGGGTRLCWRVPA